MASQKDKDYHILRNPELYVGFKDMSEFRERMTKENAEARKRYKKLHAKYGTKSMVCDKRRRNSTRKSNQRNKQMIHQIERARLKQDVISHLINEDHLIRTEPVISKGYVILN
ncbi:hypothetical protein [Mucilaginibacter terrae]|uniref:Uncharacterized protein n=1 Tax=Mucilaginibacter terrae TaxID=1955052 RepID=A0ABU3GSU5_9SPHI|nr:hypothetical protein [Mucilaginibacter terrae]MDT3402857.1 hypothetical protein [Mucilaginibacter terrae]